MRITAAIFAILLVAQAGDAPRSTPLWTGPDVNLLGTPSLDGSLVSYVDPATRNLAVRELATGKSRVLTRRKGGEFAYFSAISRKADKIAYAWFDSAGFYELRTIGIGGGEERVLFRNEEAGFVQPCAWTPGDTHVVTLFFRKDNISQIALVPLDGGPVKVLRSLMWVYPKRMDLSPDGKFIVYDSFARDGAGDRTVFVLDTAGKAETKLLDRPGNYLFPLWSPDGKRVLFIADHGGTTDLWSVRVSEGKADGEPRLLRPDLGRALPMGITQDSRYLYGLRSGETDVFVTTFTGPQADARRASTRYPGRNTVPVWSPDGRLLAYLSRRGSENFGLESRAIVIRSLESGEERELLPPLAHMERIRWSPGQASLLVSGSDGKGRGGLYIVDVKSAALTPVVREAEAPVEGYEGAWSQDGKSVLYLYGGAELRSRSLTAGEDAVLYRGKDLHRLVAAPSGNAAAMLSGSESVILLRGDSARTIAFAGATELDWGRDLTAGKGSELWRIPVDGGAPVQLAAPGNRRPGFSLHPDGKRVALTVSSARSEIHAMDLRVEIPARDLRLEIPRRDLGMAP